jgi:hypothetical protein
VLVWVLARVSAFATLSALFTAELASASSPLPATSTTVAELGAAAAFGPAAFLRGWWVTAVSRRVADFYGPDGLGWWRVGRRCRRGFSCGWSLTRGLTVAIGILFAFGF